jgi:peptidoglycan-N-acetylglucosamine deacetylase
VLRVRVNVTRFHWIVGGTLVLSLPIFLGTAGPLRWALLSVLCTFSGTWIGLGVSFPQWRMFGESLCRLPTRRKIVALTFDDGPDPRTTPALLDLLAKAGIRATFFCIGARVVQYPELARRMVDEGHRIENHSFEHSPWTNLLSTKRLRADLTHAQSEIQRIVGRSPRHFRPPMGLTNQRVFRVARELTLAVTGYTARGLDTGPAAPETIVARLLRGLCPGAILLLHDGGVPADRLQAVVRMLIDRLNQLGYECRRLDEWLVEP